MEMNTTANAGASQEGQEMINHTRAFGIELEFASRATQYASQEALRDAGLTMKANSGWAPHQHNNAKWILKTDVTAGLELTSKVLRGTAGLAELKDAMGIVKDCAGQEDLGWKITKDCGFHVHIDISDFTWKQTRNLVRLVMKYEEVIFAFQPASRKHNRWTHSIRTATYQAIANAKTPAQYRAALLLMTKYYGLNLANLLTRGTVEFRYGAGTLDEQKVTSWVTFLMGIVETAKKSRAVGQKISGRKFAFVRGDLLYNLNVMKQYRGWADVLKATKKTLIKRFKKFSGNRENATITYAA